MTVQVAFPVVRFTGRAAQAAIDAPSSVKVAVPPSGIGRTSAVYVTACPGTVADRVVVRFWLLGAVGGVLAGAVTSPFGESWWIRRYCELPPQNCVGVAITVATLVIIGRPGRPALLKEPVRPFAGAWIRWYVVPIRRQSL